MGSVFTCKLDPCCGDRQNCTPPRKLKPSRPQRAVLNNVQPAKPDPTPDGAVEALRRAKQTLERYHRAGLGDEVFHADLTDTLHIVSAALETPWQKPGRAAQAQAGEKPDFPADEQSGETSHGAVEADVETVAAMLLGSVNAPEQAIYRVARQIVGALSHPADGMSAQGTVEPEGWRLVLERGNWEMLERLRELIEGDTTFDVVADALEYVLSASPKCQAEDEEVAPAKRQGVTVQELVDIEASLDDAVRYLVDMAGAKPDPGSTQNCRAHIEQARFYARRLSALQAGEADGWQPIATAPTDGTLVLVPTSSTGLVNVVSWNDGGWRETANYLLLRNEPKVWHPLPAAPAAKPEGE